MVVSHSRYAGKPLVKNAFRLGKSNLGTCGCWAFIESTHMFKIKADFTKLTAAKFDKWLILRSAAETKV